ncbi:MAG: hypothetical protein K9K64_15270 [Desulfohalobiaceae bacterium]|nr:hypothetical protein [Desulfohalobiaceae bacterium]
MNSDSKNRDEEIIELTEVFDEDKIEEEDLDQELKDFLADTEDNDYQPPPDSEKRETRDTDSDLDSFFDRDEADEERDEEWTFRSDRDDRVSDFQDTDLELEEEPEEEGTEETAELESLFADFEEDQKPAFQTESLAERLKATDSRLDKMAEDLQELNVKLSLLPPASTLNSLVEKEEKEPEQELSQKAEDSLLEKVSGLIEDKIEKKFSPVQQDLLEKLELLESRISGLSRKTETLEKDSQALQEAKPDTSELEAKISGLSEQATNLEIELRSLQESKLNRSDLDEMKDQLKEELLTEIRKTVPRAAAEIIREEIEKMQNE